MCCGKWQDALEQKGTVLSLVWSQYRSCECDSSLTLYVILHKTLLHLRKNNGLSENVNVNDGTIHVTVNWKPDNYGILSGDDTQWNLAAMDIIHFTLKMVSDAIIFPRMNNRSNSTPDIPRLDIVTHGNLLDYISPKNCQHEIYPNVRFQHPPLS